jgi:hypothetical protein
VLSDVAATFALAEQMEEAFSAAGVAERAETRTEARTETSVTEGDVTVKVRSDGPLRTTLTAKRTPGPRQPEALYIG